ncbi:MAG: hypothetical protein HQL87_16620 [Magnetococcales bacterium]|nr:hypothetical protein [Magnetococcales bacterium]
MLAGGVGAVWLFGVAGKGTITITAPLVWRQEDAAQLVQAIRMRRNWSR